jgi:putative transposase
MQYDVAVHAYVLMTNHVHLLATPKNCGSVSKMMQQLGRKYVRYFNKAHCRTGTLWEGRFRSSTIYSVRYLFACYRYIELNPVRAGLVEVPGDYEWSSYRENALGQRSGLLTPRGEWLSLGRCPEQRMQRYQTIFGDTINEYDEQLRLALKKGRALG